MSDKNIKISTLGSQVTSIISVTLMLLVIGILCTVTVITASLSRSVRDNVTVIVKMDPSIGEEKSPELKGIIENAPFTGSYTYMSPDEVFEQEVGLDDDLLTLDENPFAAEFEITLKPEYASEDSIAAVSNRLSQIEAVDEVINQAETVRNINSILSKLIITLVCIGALLLLISVVLIFNTVSIAVYSRRFIIRTMQLVGATHAFIRRPFIKNAVWWGVISGVISSILLTGIVVYARTTGIELFMIPGWMPVAIICALLIIIGVCVCMLSAYCATSRYLESSTDNLYMK